MKIAEIEKIVLRLKNLSSNEREKILEQADRLISEKIGLAKEITLNLCYNREFCRKAGIDYSNIREEDSRLIKTAIADYLLDTRC